jgi:hypothetical protein
VTFNYEPNELVRLFPAWSSGRRANFGRITSVNGSTMRFVTFLMKFNF